MVIKSEDQKVSKSISECSNIKKKKYKGVRMRSWGSWVSEIRAPNQKTRIWLGSYSTAEAAARAYDAALLCLKGSSANLNFPNSLRNYNITPNDTVLMSPKSVQRVAAAAAAANNLDNNCTPPQAQLYCSDSSSSTSSPSSDKHCFEPTAVMDYSSTSWYNNFDDELLTSPKYDQIMFNGGFNENLPTMEDFVYEDGDIRLWSFC